MSSKPVPTIYEIKLRRRRRRRRPFMRVYQAGLFVTKRSNRRVCHADVPANLPTSCFRFPCSQSGLTFRDKLRWRLAKMEKLDPSWWQHVGGYFSSRCSLDNEALPTTEPQPQAGTCTPSMVYKRQPKMWTRRVSYFFEKMPCLSCMWEVCLSFLKC